MAAPSYTTDLVDIDLCEAGGRNPVGVNTAEDLNYKESELWELQRKAHLLPVYHRPWEIGYVSF